MEDGEDPLEGIMYRSGFDNALSKMIFLMENLLIESSASLYLFGVPIYLSDDKLRGDHIKYEGKWYRTWYLIYTVWVEFVTFINFVTVGLRFFSPGVEMVERCFTGFPFFSLSLGFFRVVYLFLFRKRFAKLIVEYDSLYKDDPSIQEEIDSNARVIRRIPRLLALLTAAPMAPWCFMPILNALRGEKWALSVPSVWPFDPFQNIFAFATVTVLQSFAAGYTTLRVVLFDNMFYCYACRQLALTRHLSRELSRILSCPQVGENGIIRYMDDHNNHITKYQGSENMRRELRKWVINHQHSLRLTKELEALYSPSLLYQYAMISINLCTTAFVVVFSNSDLLNVTLCFLYVIGNSLELLITCRFGDLITQESNNFERAIEGTHVYIFRSEYRSWLKMILIRVRIPNKISPLGVFHLNIETFKNIMVTTYSFFTLLKSMKERNE